MSYSELRQNLKRAIDEVNHTHEPLVITSNKKRSAVLISFDDYRSLEETAYLLKSPAMAKRLLEAIADIEAGKIEPHGLVEDDT
jgi:antitoxin YefM